MHKALLSLLLITSFGADLLSQQLSGVGPLSSGQQMIANPAQTAADRVTTLSAGYSQEWSGFTDAPATAFASAQLAVRKQPLAVGLFVESDRFHPFRQQSIGLTYAYSLGGYSKNTGSGQRSFQGKRNRGQLSIGLSTTLQQLTFDPTEIVSRQSDDQLLAGGTQTNLQPAIGLGLYYLSALSGQEGRSFGQIGIGVRQLLNFGNSEETGEYDGIERVTHGTLHLGYHHEAGGFIILPRLRIDYAENSPSAARFTLLAERIAQYWAGLSYDINQTIALQTGYILAGTGEGHQVRIGVLGTFNLGSAVSTRGLGFAGNITYRFGR